MQLVNINETTFCHSSVDGVFATDSLYATDEQQIWWGSFCEGHFCQMHVDQVEGEFQS